MNLDRYVDTPWGQSWLNTAEPLLEGADSGRLARGRSYASGNRVGRIELVPGRADALVRGSRGMRYRVTITLPGPGQIDGDCDCPDPAWPCKHLIATVFHIGRIVDDSPETLRTLRAHDGSDAMHADSPANTTAGRARWGTELATGALDPAEAFARPVAALPAAVTALDTVGEPCYCPPVPGSGVDLEALESLAAVAARTAMAALVEADVPGRELRERPQDPELDAIRIAVHVTDLDRLEPLASAVGRTVDDLIAASLAWTFNGPEGLEVLTDQWQPDPGAKKSVEAALAALTDADGAPVKAAKRMNRWTVHVYDFQLRYGRDERWYPFRRDRGKWWPAGPVVDDLAEIVELLQSPEPLMMPHQPIRL